MSRALLLVAVLSFPGCGGGSKASTESTTPSNKGGSTDPPPDAVTGDARVIARTREAGVIEIVGDREKAFPRALKEMEAHCGQSNFTIVQEGEEAIGTETRSSGAAKTETAWRVHYQCNAPAAP